MGCEKTKTATLGAGTMFKVSYDCGETFTLIPGMTAIGATGNMGEATETTSIDEKARTYIGSLETPPNKTFTGNYRPKTPLKNAFMRRRGRKKLFICELNFQQIQFLYVSNMLLCWVFRLTSLKRNSL